jgi:hypothetical protein
MDMHTHEGHGHAHAHGHDGQHPHHHHDEVMEVYEGEALRVKFVAADGTEYTVHFRDGELRVCGGQPLGAYQRRMDVIGIISTK